MEAMKKTALAAALVLGFSCPSFAQVKQYQIDYVKGDLNKKTECIWLASQEGDYSLSLQAIDYALEVQEMLGNDPDLYAFVETAVFSLQPSAGLSADTVSLKLGNVFEAFDSDRIRIVTLDKLISFPSASNTALVNAFVLDKMQNGEPMDNVLFKAIQILKSIGNNASFNILFIADVIDIWPSYSVQLEDSFSPMINSCEYEILQIQSGATVTQKMRILNILSKNSAASSKIRGEVAENILSNAISNIGEMKDVTREQIELQLLALQLLSDTQWTRASDEITSYFSVARQEYDYGVLSSEQFSTVIEKTASFASTDTVVVLSRYLDDINKSMEKGHSPERSVVLSVINALGVLGDKSSFDYLLYVTYLDYPEEVIIAARNALSKLKW